MLATKADTDTPHSHAAEIGDVGGMSANVDEVADELAPARGLVFGIILGTACLASAAVLSWWLL